MPIRPSTTSLALRGAAAVGGLAMVACPGVQAHAATTVFSGTSCIPAIAGDGLIDTPPENAWWVERLHLRDLAKAGLDGTGITIAVIDTGVDTTGNWFLDSDRVVRVEDFVPVDPNSKSSDMFDCTHGTSVAALIVGDRRAREDEGNKDAARVTGTDIRGIAPGAKVVALRALASSTQSDQDVAPVVKAVRRAVELKVNVINISQESYLKRTDYAEAIKLAIDNGITVVAASGNVPELAGNPSYPAAFPGVIAVGMSTPGDLAVTGSGWAPDMDIAVGAPGDAIATVLPGTWPAGRQMYYANGRGTSYAAPLVAGTVALMLQKEPGLTPAQVKERLKATADVTGSYAPPNGGQPSRPQLGAGIVNPWRAVMAPVVPDSQAKPPVDDGDQTGLQPDPPRDDRARNIALAVTGASVALAGLGLLIAKTLPLARRRGFRPAK